MHVNYYIECERVRLVSYGMYLQNFLNTLSLTAAVSNGRPFLY